MNSSPSDPFHGLDPAGLMAAAAMPTDGGADTIPLQRADLPSMAEIAAAFPDLEILGLIGHGGMSAVFKARQPKLDRIVALKVLPKSLAATPGFAERFNREGRVLARLSHPSIVAVHDFGESGGFAYLVMEFVDGVNLRQAMRAGRFTPEQALRIIPAICDALQFAHTQGVLHRDIKPENILLDTSGRVKIADFGIAKILDEKGGDMLLTQSGAKLGTAPYMAPEQIEQPSSVDHRADIYSLGVVFYEMLTGELPLGRFAAPSELSGVGGNIDEIVFRALEKERTRRQQSVGEFKTQVEGVSWDGGSKTAADSWAPFEYKSKRMLFGMPLLHVVQGNDPVTGRIREARGVFAFGGRARGIFAFGGIARGWFAFGGVAIGGVACGGLSIGLVSFAGLALGLLLSIGGMSFGTLATGGLAAGWHAHGGVAIGWHALGGLVFAHQGAGGTVHATEVMKSIHEMPWLTQSLVRIMTYSGVLGLTWLPLTLVSVVVPWWARRQWLADSGRGAAPDKRVFWLIPATGLLTGVMWWLFYRWAVIGTPDVIRFIIPTVVSCMGLLLFALSLPLWLRLVPINPLYGVRLPSTMNSSARWFDVNAHFGKHLFNWSLLVIVAGIAGFYQLPRHQDAYAWASITLTLVAVAASVVATLFWMHLHPVDAPARKKSRLMSWSGQAVVAVVIAMFIKSFIAAAYRCPNGSEPGVIKNSHWIASHLDTGFAAGDLILFQHESGQTWIARVVAREDKGLLLKRGGSPDEFFMPWDKIVGKMLFAHFSPDSVESAAPPKATSTSPKTDDVISEGSSRLLTQPPVLRFTRLKLNDTDWRWPVYAPDGSIVDNAISQPLIQASSANDSVGPDADVCRWQLWFEHPDFDRRSMISVSLTALDGSELPDRDGNFSGPGIDQDHPPLCCVIVSPGRKGKLPAAVRMMIRYSIGPWEKGSTVASAFHGGMSFSTGHLAGIGEGSDQRAFLSWAKKADHLQPDVIARLHNGQWIDWKRSLATGSEGQMIHQFTFGSRLADVELFKTRTRTIRTVFIDKVVVPPLPDDENAWVKIVGGVLKPGPVRWSPGLTVLKAIEHAGGTSAKAPETFRLIRDGVNENMAFKLAEKMEIKPDDQIIISE